MVYIRMGVGDNIVVVLYFIFIIYSQNIEVCVRRI